ncbi:MAG: sugar phosphate isomerase/epimerase family protein [Saccharofermentanales bacterium]|jgi:inosose dehydratase
MENIKLSFMNHWKHIPYKEINNFREFYYEDKSNSAYYSGWDFILRYCNATGFDGIELALWDIPDIVSLFGSASAFREYAAERHIAISGMFHGVANSHIESEMQANFVSAKKNIDYVVEFGGKHLNVCPNSNYFGIGPLSREGVKIAAKTLNKIGQYATDQGVMVGIHNEFFCAINKENHREFIELTDPKFVHYCLDTAQVAIIGEDILKFYDEYHDRICTFHLKDTASPYLADEVRYSLDPEIQDDGTRWFWEPGQGVLDFKGLFELLKKHQFKGWMTVETDGTPDLLASMALVAYEIKNNLAPIYC